MSELVNGGVARYADGGRSLPAEVPEPLPLPTAEAASASLAQLPALARGLAGVVSLEENGAFPRELLPGLMRAGHPMAIRGALREPQEHGVIPDDHDGALRITS